MNADELVKIIGCFKCGHAEDGGPWSVVRGQKIEDREQKAEDSKQLATGSRQFAENRDQKSESSMNSGQDGYDKNMLPFSAAGTTLMVGYNRRFSPHVKKLKSLLEGRSEPLAMTMTVNAGIIPPNHWVHDPERGGGRIIGEACHFIDLMVYLSGSPVLAVASAQMVTGVAIHEDKMSITLTFADGSIGTINYFANGSKAYPKETLEVFSEGRVARIDNFRRTTAIGFKGLRRFKTRRQDKGHAAEFAAFIDLVAEGGEPLIPLHELVNVSLASFAAMTSARERRYIDLQAEYGKMVS